MGDSEPTGAEAPAVEAATGAAGLHSGVIRNRASDTTQRIANGLVAWEQILGRLTQLLRAETRDATWLADFTDLTSRARAMAQEDADLALYLLIRSNGSRVEHYSARHALACMVISELAAGWMEWPEEEKQSLALAALSMNISMTALQDVLAGQSGALTESQRAQVDAHATQGADRLAEAGVTDPVWLHVVRHHHTVGGPDAASETAPGPRLAELLRRVDIYLAKLSRRGSRDSVTPAMAARDACLGADGRPDSVGATLLRVIGLYPPGTYVELANGETAVVIQRGDKAHTPVVASVRRVDWGLIKPPQRRDTSRSTLSVKRGIEPGQVRVLFDDYHLLACK